MKKIIFFLVLICIVLGLTIGAILNFSKGQGQQSGKLVQLEKSGFLFKSYEGRLELDKDTTWTFSIHHENLGEELMGQVGKRIQVEYKEQYHRLIYGTPINIVSWKKAETGVDSPLCRLVGFLRVHPEMVDVLREEIMEKDAELLDPLRHCQELIKSNGN